MAHEIKSPKIHPQFSQMMMMEQASKKLATEFKLTEYLLIVTRCTNQCPPFIFAKSVNLAVACDGFLCITEIVHTFVTLCYCILNNTYCNSIIVRLYACMLVIMPEAMLTAVHHQETRCLPCPWPDMGGSY